MFILWAAQVKEHKIGFSLQSIFNFSFLSKINFDTRFSFAARSDILASIRLAENTCLSLSKPNVLAKSSSSSNCSCNCLTVVSAFPELTGPTVKVKNLGFDHHWATA